MNPFSPHLEEAFTLILQHMRSPDPLVSIRACRTLIAADLRYKMLEYTAARAELAAVKHQHDTLTAQASEPPAPTAPSEAPPGARPTAQRTPRPPAPPRFDELREELRLAPEHRDLVHAHWNANHSAQPPLTPPQSTPSSTPDHTADAPPARQHSIDEIDPPAHNARHTRPTAPSATPARSATSLLTTVGTMHPMRPTTLRDTA